MARFAALLSLVSALVFALPTAAQITNVTDTTSTPIPGAGHDEIKLLYETVNPASGSVAIRLDTAVPQGRLLTLPFVVAYDSNGFSVQTPYLTTQGTAAWKYNKDLFGSGGWSYSVPQLSRTTIQYSYPPSPIPVCHGSTGYVFLDPAGGRHALGLSSKLDDQGLSCSNWSFQEIDSGGDAQFRANLVSPPHSGGSEGKPLVADADGTVYNFGTFFYSGGCHPDGITTVGLPLSIEDRNGNVLTLSASPSPCPTSFSYTDTLGRSVVSASGFGTNGSTVTVSGLSQPYTPKFALDFIH
jgi:hypothetical protein